MLLLSCGLACSKAEIAREGATSARASDAGQARPPEEPKPVAVDAAASAPEQGRARPSSLRAPPHGCAIAEEQELGASERGLALYLGGLPAVLAVATDGRALALWTPSPAGRFAAGPRVSLDAAWSRGAVACAASCELAWVDARGQLLALSFERAGFTSPRTFASHADRRFAPAVSQLGDKVLYAYTATVDEAMHTFLVERRGGQVSPPRDLAPPGQGAAAPVFVLGTPRPILVALDAHAGVSPLLEWTFDAAGNPSEALVRTPVSQPYTPPLLAAVQMPDAEIEVAYTAIGRVAMTAIGRVPLRRAVEPTALLPSRGYGELSFSAARGHRVALFALEVPSSPAADAPRGLALKLLSGGETYDGPNIESGAGVRRPSLASGPAPGAFLLAYTRGGALFAAQLACDD